ncbi:MAG: 23S rRNA (uracil(1939)-C(5))-methyltransferase RlmD [Rhodothermales bacterium]|jgi:23S rRNA (uracil1939-C5)-methyltransferase
MAFAKGEEIVLDVEQFADRGQCISRIDGYVVFIPNVVPGDRVRVRIRKSKKNFAEATLLEVLSPSPERTQPECKYFGSCGGCKWQHLVYSSQLESKRQSVESAFRHHGGFEDIVVPPVIGSDEQYGYRNKMEFSFSARRWLTDWEIESGEVIEKGFALGLHVPGQFDRVLDINDCRLIPEELMAFVNGVRTFALERNWNAWHIRNHVGFLRHLVVRVARHTSECMANIVTSSWSDERMAELASYVREHHPIITTLVNTIHTGVSQTSIGQSAHVVFGSGLLHEKLGRFTFEIGPSTFFQTNTVQAERLIGTAIEFADISPTDNVFDLYCGCGSISLFAAEKARHVIGLELVPEAVEAASRNAASNGIENCTFLAGDMLHAFDEEFIATHGKPDVVIVDPPRGGIHPKVVKRLARLGAPRLVYVSCNPLSQATDLQGLSGRYRITGIQPVDLFPHTHHIECVVKLELKTR